VVTVVIDCADTKAVTNTEMANLVSAVVQYNATIEAAAADLDWVYVDPNALLRQLSATPGAILAFPNFPGLPGVSADASQNTPFGTALSRDGIHPSTSTQRLIANALGTPVVGLYGPKDAAVTGPFWDRARVVRSGVACSPCTLRRCSDTIRV